MADEIRYIIDHMSPIELCMLEDGGFYLPPRLHERAQDWRQTQHQLMAETEARYKLRIAGRKGCAA